ncbi:MAG: PP2C family protein-serine/threonine phosphatase, partial [Planctomycetota bacterium]
IQEREPKDVLPHLSQRIEETGMTDVFVTMALIRADLASHRILTANAGHCPPLVRRAAEGDVIEIGGRPGLPLGVMADFDYEQSEYALKPGDVVCLVTDGVTEAMDADGNQYGTERLVATVKASPPSAEAVLEAILGDVERHVGETKQSDDLTCVCFGVEAEEGDPALELDFGGAL